MQQAGKVEMANIHARHNHNIDKFKQQFLAVSEWMVQAKQTGEEVSRIKSGGSIAYFKSPLIDCFMSSGLLWKLTDNDKLIGIYDSKSELLWNIDFASRIVDFAKAREIENSMGSSFLKWRLPDNDEMADFLDNADNEYVKSGVFFNDLSYEGLRSPTSPAVASIAVLFKNALPKSLLFVSAEFAGKEPKDILVEFSNKKWSLLHPVLGAIETTDLQPLSIEKFQATLVAEGLRLKNIHNSEQVLDPADYWIDSDIIAIDYRPCRLPKLNESHLTDPSRGIWELWGQEAESLNKFGYIARDPGKDIKKNAVAIDFGTSSTVVGMLNESGGRELLRIGVRDFFQPIEAKHFENPTVLEFLDYAAFSESWHSQAYRPELNWDWVRASHEAQASYRDNPGNTEVLASILPKLKQWALRSSAEHQLSLTGRKGKEIKVPHHTERNPLRGQELQVSANDPLDPIELYAWYLGMTINWRGRGIFLKYYLSFPVKYSREVRERMLASFRRGLQRSLPYSLIQHYPEVLNEFSVVGLASEPAAYAAAAMEHLGIEPTDEGVPYAVFDFGGGTSDFDFGLLRWADDEEDSRGFERVFEQLATSGDNVLGGENLLEQLVYASFQNNLDELRRKQIQFTLPLETRPFPGSESFLAATQAAQTNSVILSAKLRDFMESEDAALPSQIKLDLLDANGNKQSCELVLDAEQLDELLKQRITAGVFSFMHQLKQVLDKLPQNQLIHVLLAGNGSRSRHLQALTDQQGEAWQQLCEQVFGGDCPDIKIYPAIANDDQQPFAPTGKTGVALGLLAMTPGHGVLLNSVVENEDGQAPFNWYVGRVRRGAFAPALKAATTYGEWAEVGYLQDGHFNLFATTSPRALMDMKAGDAELRMHPLHFVGTPDGSKLFVRCINPNEIELLAGVSIDDENAFVTSLSLT